VGAAASFCGDRVFEQNRVCWIRPCTHQLASLRSSDDADDKLVHSIYPLTAQDRDLTCPTMPACEA
jgi:hypothetical protein